jgi:hypothetical protein
MRVWTKGLGNITLNIDFNQSEINWEDDTLFLTGWIKDPVVWNYRFTPDDHDIKALVKLLFNRHVIRFFLKHTVGKLFSFLNRSRKPEETP